MKRVVATLGVIHALAALSGCEYDGLTAEDQGAGLIAVVETEDGAEVQFIEPAPGELIISSMYMSDREDPLQALDLDTLEPTEIYQALVGTEAPAALRAVEERMAIAASQAPPDDGRSDTDQAVAPVPASGEQIRGLSAEEFQSRYCTPDVTLCWLNRTGNLSISRRTRAVEGHINVVSGQVILTTRSDGTVIRSFSVLEGQTKAFAMYHAPGVERPLRVDVTQAEGDTYHFAAKWKR